MVLILRKSGISNQPYSCFVDLGILSVCSVEFESRKPFVKVDVDESEFNKNTFHLVGTGIFPRGQSSRDVKLFYSKSSAEIKNAWNRTSISSYGTTSCLIKHRDTLLLCSSSPLSLCSRQISNKGVGVGVSLCPHSISTLMTCFSCLPQDRV